MPVSQIIHCQIRVVDCAYRGSLGNVRNFVVEEIIMKLGHELGFVNSICLEPSKPPAWPKGKFKCPHCPGDEMYCSVRLLPHMRDRHRNDLKDKLRTNPNTKWFQYNLSLVYTPGRKAFSFHVSEMGLLTFCVILPEVHSNEPIRTWVQALNKSNYT